MSEIKNLVIKYALRLKTSSSPRIEFEKIYQEIEKLDISSKEKHNLINNIVLELGGARLLEHFDRPFRTPSIEAYSPTTKATDNEKYLDLIQYILSKTKGK